MLGRNHLLGLSLLKAPPLAPEDGEVMQQARFPPGALGLAAISAIDHCLWNRTARQVTKWSQ
jgi:L-alanine-DL-glutamate epimerase-like enolase superfamily enzyme